MIKLWKLKRFKSVRDPVELDFASLTVFAGANSSGKSTIIQSILLTAQTLQSSVYSRPVVLNGHMARLGGFTDLVSDANRSEAISVGFRLELSQLDDMRLRQLAVTRAPRAAYRRMAGAEGKLAITSDFSFSMRGPEAERDILNLQPRLEESRFSVSLDVGESPQSEDVVVSRSTMALPERIESLRLSREALNSQEISSLDYEIVRASEPSRTYRGYEDLAARRNAGASLRHFLPVRLSIVFDAVETEVRQVVGALTEPASARWFEFEGGIGAELGDDLRHLVRAALRALAPTLDADPRRRMSIERRLKEFEGAFRFETLLKFLHALTPTQQGAFAQLLSEQKESLRTAIRAGRQPSYAMRFVPVPDLVGLGSEAVQSFFSFSVKYLGPLRDEPKPVYPLAGATDPGDVGFRGEHTAAVLDLHRNSPIQYIPSRYFLREEQPVPHPAKLLDAVLDWLAYMGVGSQLRTVDQGKLGHELKIGLAEGGPLHDLTQVGVGVSQVLPILVLSLLADPGATLIFEQPELHLHPRVQTRLADFFVALTQLGKQCIVETHSEYLITRLRYRAARASGRDVAGAVMLYFVEKHGGQSVYRPVRINEFGVIEEWPQGFFDDAEANAASVLKAGLEKRRNRLVDR